jgi:hypothetical protein
MRNRKIYKKLSKKNKEENPPSTISTIESSTMTKVNLVSSYPVDISQDNIGQFEKYTRGIRPKLLRWMGYDG